MKDERYIADGRTFNSFDEVETYAKQNGYRISHTETIRKGIFLVYLNK